MKGAIFILVLYRVTRPTLFNPALDAGLKGARHLPFCKFFTVIGQELDLRTYQTAHETFLQ